MLMVRSVADVALVVGLAACQESDPGAAVVFSTETPSVVEATGASTPTPKLESPQDFIRRWQQCWRSGRNPPWRGVAVCSVFATLWRFLEGRALRDTTQEDLMIQSVALRSGDHRPRLGAGGMGSVRGYVRAMRRMSWGLLWS